MAIWERRPGEEAKPAYCFEWVHHVKQENFFDDGSFLTLERGRETIERLNDVLLSWGLEKLPPRPNTKRRN
jgi:hypothetical protein